MEVEHFHNHLKYSICLTRVGKYVFHKVFQWGYTGGGNFSLKETIFDIPGYHKGRFRKDFNEVQREKLENHILIKDLDVRLLFKLLQLVCSLSDSDDSKWYTESSDSLEYNLHLIYSKYNEMVQENTNLSNSEICTQIENLRGIFTNIIQISGKTFSLSGDELKDVEVWVDKELNSIKESLSPSGTFVEYEKEIEKAYIIWLKEEGYEEASLNVTSISQIVLDPWLNLVNPFIVNDLFIDPLISLEKDIIQQRQLSIKDSIIPFPELLVNSDKDTSNVDFILISSRKGMGKTTMIKQILHSFYYDKKILKGLASFNLALYLKCYQSTFDSIDDMIAACLPLCSSFLGSRTYRKAFFSLKLLIILDDIEGLSEKSLNILEELCTKLSPGSQILATVCPERINEMEQRGRLNVKIRSFELHGIPESHVQIFCKKFVEQCPISGKVENEKMKIQVENEKIKRLETLMCDNSSLQNSLKSPEFLTVISLLLAHSSCKLESMSTISELLMQFEELLLKKFVEATEKSLEINGMNNNDILKKYQEFLQVMNKEILCSLVTGKNFAVDNVEEINNKCLELNIPCKKIVSLFLGFCNDQESSLLEIFNTSSYNRKLYYAASYIAQQILKKGQSLKIMEVLDNVVTDKDIALESLTFQRIIRIVIGILTSHENGLLNSRASEITSILKESGVTNSTDWIQYIEESKDNKTLIDEILREMGPEWDVEDKGISRTLIFLLRYKPPSSLKISINENPANCQYLLETIQICSKLSINLSILLSHHFLIEKEVYSDQYLDALKRGSSRCKLVSFSGRISMSSIFQLPRTIKKLSLHANPSMIGFLNARLPSLINQPELHLNLDIVPGTSPSSIPALKAKGMDVYVHLWNIDASSLEWSCEIIHALSSTFKGLTLQNSSLNCFQTIKWVRNLHTLQEVFTSELKICSRKNITGEEEDKLKNYSNLLGCHKFEWVRL